MPEKALSMINVNREESHLHSWELLGGITEAADLGSHLVEHSFVERAERSSLIAFDVSAGTKLSTGLAAKNERNVARVVAVAIADTGSKQYH